MIADDMEPEDSCLTVYTIGNLLITAFTPFGIESLKKVIPMYRREANES